MCVFLNSLGSVRPNTSTTHGGSEWFVGWFRPEVDPNTTLQPGEVDTNEDEEAWEEEVNTPTQLDP